MRGAAALLAGALALAGCGPAHDAAAMPDVLLVSLDTLRADRLSCYGNPRPTTPHLDGLAARGLRFADAIAPSSHTAPSHMSLLTGLEPFAHGVFNRDLTSPTVLALDGRVPTLQGLLAESGWTTAAITQEGQLLPEIGFARDFDHTDFVHDSFLGRIAALDDYLSSQPSDRPQFVFLHTYEPHAPYLPPRQHGLEPFYGVFTDRAYQGGFRAATEALLDGPPGAKVGAPQFDAVADPGPDDVRFLSDLYDENVRWTDHLVGELLAVWGRHRDLERTLVVVLSDHGEAFLEHGRLGHHEGLYRELVHVPLIVAGPGVDPGVVEETVGLVGLPAALLEFLGVEAPATMAPPLAGLSGVVRAAEPVFPQLYLRSRGRAQYAGVDAAEHYHSSEDGPVRTEELFDRASDPLQARDVGPERPEALERWRELVGAARARAQRFAERFPVTASGAGAEAERLEQLERLGYK